MKKYILIILCVISTLSNGATITVTNSSIVNGDGQCDLVDAINSANTDTSVDSCTSGNLTDTILLSTNVILATADNGLNGLPLITSNLIISSTTSVDRIIGRLGGSPNFRMFEITNQGNLELINIAVSGGNIAGSDGGCIYNIGSLTLTNSELNSCITNTKGGAIYTSGTLQMTVSIIRQSAALTGGAVYMDLGATSLIDRSNILSNSSGIFAQNGSNTGSLDVFRSNVLSNSAEGINTGTNTVIDRSSINENGGEGLLFTTTDGNSFKLINSTISTNSLAGLDSLSTVSNVANITLSNNTFSGNGTGDGSPNLNVRSGLLAVNNLNINNNIFDNVFGPNECSVIANIISSGNNISDDNSCPSATVSASINLNPLVNNVHTLASGSSAQDTGNNSICSNADVNNIDQRGTSRPFNGVCDIGSIESTIAPPTGNISLTKLGTFNDSNSDGFAQAGETISYSFTVENTGGLTLSNLTITDPLISVPGTLATLNVGAINNSTFSAAYTLLQSDIDNGQVSNIATVNATDPSSNNVSDQSNAGIPLVTNLNTAASISLLKAATFNDVNSDGFAQAGETISYSFTIENTGDVTLSNVSISDPLISVPGTLASLAPGAVNNSTFSGTYTLLQSDIDNGQVSNIATVNATDPSSNNVSAQSNAGVPLVTNLNVGTASITLIKAATFIDSNSDGFAQAGETINYSFTVENTGTLTLSNVNISDPLISVPGSIISLNPSVVDTSTFTGTYTLMQSDIDNGQVSNLATVSATDPSSNNVSAQSNAGVPLVTNLNTAASISLLKSATLNDTNSDGFAQAGETINYSFTVENTGGVTLSNVTISDPLISVPGTLAALNVGAINNSTFSGVYTLLQSDIDAGMVSNLATVNATDPSSNAVTAQSNAGVALVTNLNTAASISLLKSATFNDLNSDGFAQAGENISYSFTVENTGDVTLTNVSVSDPLISVPGILASFSPATVDNSTFSGAYTLSQSDIDNGQVSNIATVNATDPGSNNVSAQSNAGVPLVTNLNVGTASITLIKAATFIDSNSDGFAQAGETINYSFVVENTGGVTLSNLSINDPLMSVTGTLSTLNVGANDNSTFTGVYTLLQSDIDTGSVSNLAIVNATDPSSNPVTAQSNAGVPLVTNLSGNARITLTKAARLNDTNSDGFAQAGETISYSFIVENTGGVTLSNVTISDPLISVPGSLSSLNVGAIDNSTFSGTYTLLQSDIDAGFVSNLATVNATDPSSNAVTAQSNAGVALITNLNTAASISLLKAATFNDTNSDGFAQAGETISYSFTVENTGGVTLSNATISDPLVSVPGTLASLAPGAVNSTMFTVTYTLLQSDIDNGQVTNLATVNATDPSSNAVSAQSNAGVSLVTNLNTAGSISLIKTAVLVDENNDGFAQVGETVMYLFRVDNTGNLTLSNITISDPLVSVPGTLATLSVLDFDDSTFTGTYTLTQTDIDARMVSNLATVNATDPLSNAVTAQSNAGVPLVTTLSVYTPPEIIPTLNIYGLLFLLGLIIMVFRKQNISF